MDEQRIVNSIVKEIMNECQSRKLIVFENFIHHLVHLLHYDPKWKICSNHIRARLHMQDLIQFIVSMLANENHPSLITLKMQFYFECNFRQMRDDFALKNRNEFLSKLQSLRKFILDSKNVTNLDLNKLYRKLTYFITLAGGLGNPSIDMVYRDVIAAVKSILNEVELIEYLQQPRTMRSENLDLFVKLVVGIRLYHQDQGKQCEGMSHLDISLKKNAAYMKGELQTKLTHTSQKIKRLTDAIENSYITEKCVEKQTYSLQPVLPENVTNADFDNCRDVLIMLIQYEIYLQKLLVELDVLTERAKIICKDLHDQLTGLTDCMGVRIAIPAVQVFPYFECIATIWFQIQDETLILTKIQHICRNLSLYIEQVPINNEIIEQLLKQRLNVATESRRLRFGAEDDSSEEESEIQSASISLSTQDSQSSKSTESSQSSRKDLPVFTTTAIVSNENPQDYRLEYLGFCGWKLSKTGGALIPSKPEVGAVNILNMNYGFSSLNALAAFTTMPESSVLKVLALARRKPELILLLNLEDQLSAIQGIEQLAIKPSDLGRERDDVGIQTDLHAPLPNGWDRNYHWNIWHWKSLAILLANLSKTNTRRLQTENAYDGGLNKYAQTYGIKENSSQTRKDGSSNVYRPWNYIFGLRGRKDDKQFIIDLSRVNTDV